jgi:hemerythrin-like domain-containing protein
MDRPLARRPGFDDPLALMHALHRRLQLRCTLLVRLAAHLRERGTDPDARSTAQHVLRCFDEDCPVHHEDEERDLFQVILASVAEPDRERIGALVRTLVGQHADMQSAYAALRPQIEAVGAGRTASIDPQLADRFQTLCFEHVEVEERELIPLARALLSDAQIAVLGGAMAQRRGPDRQR